MWVRDVSRQHRYLLSIYVCVVYSRIGFVCHCRHIIYILARCVYKGNICLHGFMHAYARCIYHRALCGCEHRMFVCANRKYNMFALCAEYVFMHTLWDGVHKCVCVCLEHMYICAV